MERPLPVPRPHPGHRELSAGIQALLDAAVTTGVTPSAVCAVALNGTALTVLHAGAGNADTFYDLASVTKIVTTLTALSLVDDGVLDLDAPLADILAAYRLPGRDRVTLRHLLTHTSGLPAEWRGWQVPLRAGRRFDRAALVEDLLALEVAAPPGTRFTYSCAGFNTVMVLAERATQLPWRRLVEDRVLSRLGTGLSAEPPAGLAAPTEYQPEWGRGLVHGTVHDEAAWSLGGLAGNAGLFGTADGVLALGEALRTGLPGILSPALAAEMWRSQLPRVLGRNFDSGNPGFGHGLGLRINQQPWMGVRGVHARGHGGFTGTSLLVDRESRLSIALLTNRVHPSRSGDDATCLRTAVSDAAYAGA